jgi:OOP family OmpA-OmpF porin
MSKLLILPVLAASVLTPLSASADDFYAGLSGARGGEVTFTNPLNGKSATDRAKPQFKLYGGWSFADNLALEAGYSQSGDSTFNKSSLGLAADPTFKIRTLSVAGRWSHQFNDDWSMSLKAGLARNRFSASDGAGERDSLSNTKPLLGVGVAYNVSKNIALTLDFEHIGRTRRQGLNVDQQGLQFGARIGF